MWKGALAAAVAFSCAIACGSSDTKTTSDTQQACNDFQAKLTQCQLTSAKGCGALSTCMLQCEANATCTELLDPLHAGSYLNCQAACNGIGPDPFVCADGHSFVDKRARCDGQPLCSDGSDELGCNGVGGASGGGGASSGGGASGEGGASSGGGASGGEPGAKDAG